MIDIKKINNISDENTFNEVFHSLFDKTVRFITSIVKSEEVAMDLEQDIFVKLWHSRETIELKSSIDAYIFVAAKNSAFRYLQREKLKDIFVLSADKDELSHTLDEIYDVKETFDKVKRCIMAMPEPRREIFILSRKRAMTNQQIADKFSVTVKSVEYHITKALSELKEKCFEK